MRVRRGSAGRVEVADAAVRLLHEARFATGAVLSLDGGTTAV